MFRKRKGNILVASVLLIVGGVAALFAGYLIVGYLDAQFTALANQQNLSADYTSGIQNTRNIAIAVFGLLGVTMLIYGAMLLIKVMKVASE